MTDTGSADSPEIDDRLRKSRGPGRRTPIGRQGTMEEPKRGWPEGLPITKKRTVEEAEDLPESVDWKDWAQNG